MRRIGYVIEKIVESSNMENSFKTVLRGTERKQSTQGRYLLAHKEEVMKELADAISTGTYKVSGYRERIIEEASKERKIQILTMKDRIAVHAVMSVVDEHIRQRFIRTTSASIKGRGMHDLMKYIRRDIAEDAEGTEYCLKLDVRKYYESINQDIMMESVKRVFKDKKLISILDGFVRMMPQGLSIGLRSSQGLGNLFLSEHIDHYVKDELGVPYYYRYCDDIVVLGKSKAELWQIRDLIHQRLENISLTIKNNERVFATEDGIDFLGYVIRPDYVRLRKRIKVKMARKMHEVKSKRRRRELISSFYGMAKHANCILLFNKLTGTEMKSFKDLKVAYQPEDGKKRFAGTVVSIRELVNLPIVVKDFELGIKTEQGEDRCIVSIEQNGEAKKFFTNSGEMKNILQQISQMEDGFPFETTIKTEQFGKGRTKYIFT